jgi:hypothetical protein
VVENKKDDTKMVILPVYDISWDEWIIQLEDGSFKRISHEEYEKLYVFKTRYDVENK